MRKEFSSAIEKIVSEDKSVVFITGDLGFHAFENLKKWMGDRFINAGVAEQNMIGLAAGMAHKGFKVFCYSIAPFIIYRCLEQFRNDVCSHKLPVFLVGNGGGYGYGIMGSTHHALEDLACMSSMPNATCWAPAFNDEVEVVIRKILKEEKPAYLRLNNSINQPTNYSSEECLNSVIESSNPVATIVVLGSIITNVLSALTEYVNHFDLFTAICFPLSLPDKFVASISKSKKIIIVEEHVAVGGVAQQLFFHIAEKQIHLDKMISLHAKGYPNGLYGDQKYHQQQSSVDIDIIATVLKELYETKKRQ